MFGSLGGPEILLLMVLALLLFGPRKLPEIGRTLGKSLSEFRRATTEFKSTLQREVDLEQVREVGSGLSQAKDEIRQSMAEAGKLSVPRDVLTSENDRPSGDGPDSASTSPPADDRPNRDT